MQAKLFAAAAIAALLLAPSAGAQQTGSTGTATNPFSQPISPVAPGLVLSLPPATAAPGTPGTNIGNAITPQDLSGFPNFGTVAPGTSGINTGNATGQ